MKRCNKCLQLKPFADFYAMKGMRDGYRNDCKACNLAAAAARHETNPTPGRERAKRWRQNNPERVAQRKRADRDSGKAAIRNRRSYLKRKYGLTVEEYEAMLEAQGGVCAICLQPGHDKISLHVDHDHATGERRGLLCFRDNNALGDFNDDRERLLRAAAYLLDHDAEMAELAALAKERVKALRKAA